MTTYTVNVERGASGTWVLQCAEHPGAISEARSLAAAPALMREAIAFVAEIDAKDVEIEIKPVLPENAARQIAEAREAVRRLAQVQRETAELSRSTVRRLATDYGYTGRDIAILLDISPQRVSQLAR